jgi:hypothetical protein
MSSNGEIIKLCGKVGNCISCWPQIIFIYLVKIILPPSHSLREALGIISDIVLKI